MDFIVAGLRTLSQLLTAGIAITAFSLLLYALTFNLRDRVARSFAAILVCVVVIYAAEAMASVLEGSSDLNAWALWLRFEWVGIIFLPVTYLHFSDALLETTGRPSRGRRRWLVRVVYVIGIVFLVVLPFGTFLGLPDFLLFDTLSQDDISSRMQLLPATWFFGLFYIGTMSWALVNFWRAFRRAVTSASQRRMFYLLLGASAPALGSFPYSLFIPGNFSSEHPFVFWFAVVASNILVAVLTVMMAYAVAFFGVSWPERVVKRRLFKWLLRGPGTASIVLALATLTRRLGEQYNQPYSALVPVVMAASIVFLEFMITLAAPVWERLLFHGGDRSNAAFLQGLEERLVTTSDLRQFLEALLAAICDRVQTDRAFLFTFNPDSPTIEIEMVVTAGRWELPGDWLNESELMPFLADAANLDEGTTLFKWGKYWLMPLFSRRDEIPALPAQTLPGNESQGEGTSANPPRLIGLLGAAFPEAQAGRPVPPFDEIQREDLAMLSRRAVMVLEDRAAQQRAFAALAALSSEMDIIQKLGAVGRYEQPGSFASRLSDLESTDTAILAAPELERWVKDALTHYWGGPKLTQNPLLRFEVVKRAIEENEESPANALRAILRQAIDRVRPEGERRFTADWMLYNILEMKFMEGRKVREIAMRLAMSEADLYRKQRVAIESVARAILEMESQAREIETQEVEVEQKENN
jgi:hypothetical protein